MMDDNFGQTDNQSNNQTMGDQNGTPVAPPTNNYIDEYVPPQADSMPPAAPADMSDMSGTAPADNSAQPQQSVEKNDASQTLEDQNIFTLLGVDDGTDEEKEGFLDELQQVIWEDFLDNDVELLLTEQEMTDLKVILDKADATDLQKQEDAVVFLEKLIPDLEEIMLEKALELKEAMVRERISGFLTYYENDPEKLELAKKAGVLADQGMWKDAAELMNSTKSTA